MNFKTEYPDFASIEEHVRAARVERSVAIATWLSNLVVASGRGLRRLLAAANSGLAQERDRRAIEADAFLKRSVPKY
jgi:cell division inhibitor SulA